MRIGASIGIAAHPEHGSDLAALLRHADVAMYEAKRRRSAPSATPPRSTATAATACRSARTSIARSSGGEFVLHYQPKCDACTGAAIGVEALVRWQHPERGLLFPDAFLTLIEQRGMTARLTETVLALAAVQAARVARHGHRVPIAVNLTATDLLD